MRGKKAKKLRKMVLDICIKTNVPPFEPRGEEYGQVKNCHSFVPSGKKDIDGTPLLQHVLAPGTIFHKSRFMVFYKALKRAFGCRRKVK